MEQLANPQVAGNIASGAKLIGGLAQFSAERRAGDSAARAAGYQAAQLRQNAGQAQAAGTIRAEEATRLAKLNVSRAIAVAAASGGGTVDPSVLNILSGLDSEGKLSSLTALYEGDSQAAAMRRQAAATEYEGGQVKEASRLKATGTLMSAASSFGGFDFSTKKKAAKGAPTSSWKDEVM